MNLTQIRNTINIQKGRRLEILANIKKASTLLHQLQDDLSHVREAHWILQEAAQRTQTQLTYHISSIVTLALKGVFGGDYELSLAFDVMRGKTNCLIGIKKEGELYENPLDDCAGGVVDVASFGLRLALWSLKAAKIRNILVLDEPFKWVQGQGLGQRTSEMIKELSRQLNIQILLVTNSNFADIDSVGDKRYELSIVDKLVEIKDASVN